MKYVPSNKTIFITNPDDKRSIQPESMEEYLKRTGKKLAIPITEQDNSRSVGSSMGEKPREAEATGHNAGSELRIKADYILHNQDLFTKEQVKKAKQIFTI